MDVLAVLVIVIAVCFVVVIATSYRTDRTNLIAGSVGLLLTLILLFSPQGI